jgi:hypothetical protein
MDFMFDFETLWKNHAYLVTLAIVTFRKQITMEVVFVNQK